MPDSVVIFLIGAAIIGLAVLGQRFVERRHLRGLWRDRQTSVRQRRRLQHRTHRSVADASWTQAVAQENDRNSDNARRDLFR